VSTASGVSGERHRILWSAIQCVNVVPVCQSDPATLNQPRRKQVETVMNIVRHMFVK
jgi:hypothetical protein